MNKRRKIPNIISDTFVKKCDCFIDPFMVFNMWVHIPGKKPAKDEPRSVVGMQDNSIRVSNAETLYNQKFFLFLFNIYYENS